MVRLGPFPEVELGTGQSERTESLGAVGTGKNAVDQMDVIPFTA
jgi:hypothetical protein